MVLEGLGKSLRKAISRITGASSVDEELIKEVTRDLQRALLEADVNVQMVLGLTKKIEDRVLREKPPAGSGMKEYTLKVIREELISMVDGGEGLKFKPQRIMMVGLYGQGKTTTSGKLALLFTKHNLSVGLIAADVHRPAAYDQLSQLGQKVNVEVYGEPNTKDAAAIVERGLRKFKDKKVVIIDTSGRHALEDDLIDEIKRIADVAKPDERLLVLDAQVGQQAGPQADAFHKAVGVTGVILTKMDGTAKGGGALSAVNSTKARIVCIGTGEHIRDLDRFDPEKFISRLLGGGDLSELVRMARDAVDDEEKAAQVAESITSGKFTLKEMYYQMESLNKMGPLKKVLSMIPGFSSYEDKINYEETQRNLARFRHIMDSMTEAEKEDPNIIKASRAKRIAEGSGTEVKDVRTLIKQFNTSKKAIKGMMGNRKMRKQMMKQMGTIDFDAEE
ncbi:MAG: signal recognition particle protein [Thermoplasmatales archaeon]|nr:signal recognition particle protein [Thermoplasmatales archaeon]